MIQGSEEWLQARLGVVTASNFSKVFTTAGKLSTSREGLINQLIAENLTQKPTEVYKTDAMARGTELEPQARAMFEIMMGVDVEEVGLIKMKGHDIGCSPDGLFSDGYGATGLEVKCPLPATHCAYLREDKLPTNYVQQVQGTMLILGLERYFFMSFHPEMKPLIIEVKRDDKLLELAEPLLIETAEIVKSETQRLRIENDIRQ